VQGKGGGTISKSSCDFHPLQNGKQWLWEGVDGCQQRRAALTVPGRISDESVVTAGSCCWAAQRYLFPALGTSTLS